MVQGPFWFARLAATAAAACVVIGSGATASAALLAYDPFNVGVGPGDYVAGDENAGTNLLGGQNPSIGPTAFYNGGWIQSGADTQAVKNIGSLAYPLFPQSGGQVQETLQFDCCTFGRSAREIAGGLGGEREARTFYQSFLIDFGSQGTDMPADFGKRGYEMFNGGVGDAFLTVDLFLNHFSGVNELTLAVTTPSGSTSVPVGGGGLTLDALAGTHLVVFRFDFDPTGADVVSLYLDPTTSVESDYLAAAAIAVAASDLFITHHSAITNYTFSGDGHVPGAFDEVRWGDTFADVTPFQSEVPLPSAFLLFGASLFGAPLLRRRKGAKAAGVA